MQVPLQITFRDIDPSPHIEAAIRKRAERLDRFHPRIIGCHVTVRSRHHSQQKGRLYNVGIDLTLPGDDVHVRKTHRRDHAHEDVYVAIRDAFDAAVRQMEDRARITRREVKAHELPPHGQVIKLFPEHGFIELGEAGEVYFHKNSVADGKFEQLEIGTEVVVSVAEDESGSGWQATTVRPVGKHHLVE